MNLSKTNIQATALGLVLCACTMAPAEDGATGSSSQALASAGNAFAWIDATRPAVNAQYAYDSAGGSITYSHDSLGNFTVRFPGLGVSGAGNVQVSAYGAGGQRCRVTGWWPEGDTLAAHVVCELPGGTLFDTSFSIAFQNVPLIAGQIPGAYLYSGTAGTSLYQWNSSGGTNTVSHLGMGQYRARLPGLTFTNASVLVTAYGTGNAHYCTVGDWSSDGSAVNVPVFCFDANGNAADGLFTLSYDWKDLVPGSVGGHGHIDGATTTAPAGTASSGPTGSGLAPGSVSVSLGRDYAVAFTGVWSPSSLVPSSSLVSAHGSTSNYCSVASWGGTGGEADVHVACFDRNGASTTSSFDVTYTTSVPQAP